MPEQNKPQHGRIKRLIYMLAGLNMLILSSLFFYTPPQPAEAGCIPLNSFKWCNNFCGGATPFEVGGIFDLSNIGWQAWGDGCSGAIANWNSGAAPYTALCSSAPPL